MSLSSQREAISWGKDQAPQKATGLTLCSNIRFTAQKVGHMHAGILPANPSSAVMGDNDNKLALAFSMQELIFEAFRDMVLLGEGTVSLM